MSDFETFLRRNRLTFCILTVICLSWMKPEFGAKGGFLKPEITVKYVAVVVIFLISGLSLRTEDLARTIFDYHVHLFIQSYTLVVIPLLVHALVIVLKEVGFNENIADGLTVVSCMPPPVSSAIILTKAAGGNEAIAVFNSVLGSFLGAAFTPFLLVLMVGSSAAVPLSNVVPQLTLTIVVPLVAGQFLRRFIARWANKNKDALATAGSYMLLLIIYTTFCDTFMNEKNQLQLSTILITIMIALFKEFGRILENILSITVIVILIQVTLMYMVLALSSLINQCNPADSVAVMFCATHKSLTLGIPMLRIMYEGDENLIQISFPLLLYHPAQILFGSLLIPRLRRWITREWYKGNLWDA